MTTPEPLLFECHDVHYAYQGRFTALNGIDIAISKGERIALVGANGCGKSTLLNLLDGLLFPNKGTITYLGRELTEGAFLNEKTSIEFRKNVGLVFQNPDVQLFCPTVREEIAFGPLHLGIDETTIHERTTRLVDAFNITHLLDRSPHQLSVGEKRKVSFASVLAMDPQVLLLDEPTAGLDPLTSTHLIEMLASAAGSGKTIITATHDLHIIGDIADTVYVFGQDRKIAAHGNPVDILADTPLLHANNLIHRHTHHASDHKVMKTNYA